MSDGTKIEWTDATWNPVTGCSVVSPGCTNCYAMGLAGTRLRNHPSRAGLTDESKAGPVWNGKVRLNEDWLTQPLKWRRPRTIFVCAHGDLFHENVPDEWIDRVFRVINMTPHHTYQILTKRARRMRQYMSDQERVIQVAFEGRAEWPPRNAWLGVSADDQKRADERIPDLLATPAAVRFVSAEPLLGPIDFRRWLATAKVLCKKCKQPFWLHEAEPCQHGNAGWTLACPNCGDCRCTPKQADRGDPVTWGPPSDWTPKGAGRFDRVHPTLDIRSGPDWIIVGGESGPNARPMQVPWARSIVQQCKASGVACFVKQLGADPIWEDGAFLNLAHRKGADMAEWPDDLRVREVPDATA